MTLNYCPKEFIEFSNLLSEESSKIILKYFRSDVNVESKKDNTPVTVADKESESLI